MVVVPGLTHLAILAINQISKREGVFLIDNGLFEKEREILDTFLPNISTFKLKNNRLFGQQMVDTHPEVIETLAYVPKNKVVFIDPDCYIFDNQILDDVIEKLDYHLFTSPFCSFNEELKETVPETFLIGMNTKKLRKIKEIYGTRFGESSLSVKLKELVWRKWQVDNPWPQPYKKIYDTIHVFLLAGFLENMTIGRIKHDINALFHVCGTSYNQLSFQSVKDNDLLIINAHYFHLRVIEMLQLDWLNEYFKKLIHHYESSKRLLHNFEGYAKTELCKNIDKLITEISKQPNSLSNNA